MPTVDHHKMIDFLCGTRTFGQLWSKCARGGGVGGGHSPPHHHPPPTPAFWVWIYLPALRQKKPPSGPRCFETPLLFHRRQLLLKRNSYARKFARVRSLHSTIAPINCGARGGGRCTLRCFSFWTCKSPGRCSVVGNGMRESATCFFGSGSTHVQYWNCRFEHFIELINAQMHTSLLSLDNPRPEGILFCLKATWKISTNSEKLPSTPIPQTSKVFTFRSSILQLWFRIVLCLISNNMIKNDHFRRI